MVGQVIDIVMPINQIGIAIRKIVEDGENPDDAKIIQILPSCLTMLCQGIVYALLLTYIDRRHSTSYKGTDKKQASVDRLQLEEKEDVI